jgi:hypothetical protein
MKGESDVAASMSFAFFDYSVCRCGFRFCPSAPGKEEGKRNSLISPLE